jgi:formylglycine-generating enzyme required for sulfatase activity
MSGNVQEFCWDWYIAPMTTAIGIDGPVSGTQRVARSGDWKKAAGATSFLNVSNRNHVASNWASDNVGFRVAANAAE